MNLELFSSFLYIMSYRVHEKCNIISILWKLWRRSILRNFCGFTVAITIRIFLLYWCAWQTLCRCLPGSSVKKDYPKHVYYFTFYNGLPKTNSLLTFHVYCTNPFLSAMTVSALESGENLTHSSLSSLRWNAENLTQIKQSFFFQSHICVFALH